MDKENSNSIISNKLSKFFYIAIPVFVFLIYFNTISFDFVNCDDYDIIVANYELISDIDNWATEIFRSYMDSPYYRPVINLSFLIDAQIGGKDASYYRFVNILLHAICSVLIFILLTKLDFSRNKSLIGAFIFAAHPLFVNAVVWIPGRNDIIFALFALLSLIFFDRTISGRKTLDSFLFALFFLLALLSKETALVLPLTFIFYAVLVKREKFGKKKIITTLLVWAAAIVFWFITRSSAKLGESFNEMGIDVFTFNLQALLEYIGKFFVPYKISVLPTYDLLAEIVGAIVIVVLIALFFIRKEKNAGVSLFGFLWFLILSAPGLYVRRLNAADWNDYLECRAYAPAIGLLIILLGLIPAKWERKKAFATISVLVVLALSALSIYNSQDYKNPISFYKSAVEDDSSRAQFHYQLGKNCLEADKMKLAEEAFVSSAALKPNTAKYQYNLGVFYERKGAIDSAVKYLNIAIKLDSSYKNAYLALSSVHQNENRTGAAEAVIKSAVNKFGDKELFVKLIGLQIENDEFAAAKKIARSYSAKFAPDSNLAAIFLEKGLQSYDKGKKEKTKNYWKIALAIDSANSYAVRNLFQYYLLVEPDYRQAQKYADKAAEAGIKLKPKRLEYLERKMR